MVALNTPFTDSSCPDEAGSRLILASNRGPVEHHLTDSGSIRQRDAGGGVAVALRSIAESRELTWIAAAGSFGDQIVARARRFVPIGRESRLRLVSLPGEAYDSHYGSFCNPLLWFVQHSLGGDLDACRLGENALEAWRHGYVPVNRAFADALNDEIEGSAAPARVMLHDYHLYLVPRMIRSAHPHVPMQHFVHIPWPQPEAWAPVPACAVRQICLGLLANDSVAFQDEESVDAFKDTCATYLGRQVTASRSSPYIQHADGHTLVWSNPISVDVAELKSRPGCEPGGDAGIRTILRVDRLDPTKNVMRGFQAYELLLTRRPELQGKVRFVAWLVPSRTGIREYDDYAAATLALVDSINRRLSTPSWQPIMVVQKQDRPQAMGLLGLYDVLLVNPLADGMNLVAKEGPVVNQRDGCLVLSQRAGAHRELANAALSIDPLDVPATAAALERALDMPGDERAARARRLRESIESHQLSDWLRALLKDLDLTAHERAAGRSRV